MADTIRIRRRVSGSPGAPASLQNAEIAYNETDHTLYYGEGTGGSGGSASVVVAIGGQGLASSVTPTMAGVGAPGTASQWSRGDHVHPTDTTRAPLNSPALTGTPTAPTVTPGTDSSTKLATTAFVQSAVAAVSSGVTNVAAGTGLTGGGTGAVTISVAPNGISNALMAVMPTLTLKGNNTGASAAPIDLTAAQTMTMLGAAPTASPTFSGTVTAPKIVGLTDPSNPQDAATKNYVDATVQGMTPKPTAWVATVGALPTNTYANGTAGVGATLTATANAALSVDGVAVAAGQIVLVKNEATAANNGLYAVTNAGSAGAPYVLTRHADMDTSGEFSGAMVPVGNAGTANANSLWLANPSTPITVGTTPVPFTQLNSATSYTAGNGINISANTISAVGTANRIVSTPSGIDVASTYAGQASINTLGTITSGVWNGTAIALAYIAGLGTMASQSANAVAITGGTIDGIVLDGGTF